MSEDIVRALVGNEEFYKKLIEMIYERLKNEVVLNRLDEINKVLNELSNAVQKNTDHIVLLWEKLDQHEGALRQLMEALRDQGIAIKEMQKVLQIHSQKIEELQKAVEKQGQILEQHSKVIEGLQRTVEKLEVTVEQHSKAIEGLQKAVDQHSKTIEGLEKAVENHSKVIEGLVKAVEKLGATVEQHSKAIEGLQKAVERLENITEQHSKAIEGLEKAVENHSKAIEGLQRAVEKLEATVEQHSKAIEKLEKAVDQHSKVIEGLQKEMTKLSTEIGGFTSRAGKAIERTILNIYKEALLLHGVDPTNVKHGKIKDTLGVVDKDKEFEVDFYETDDYVYEFEVKNYADEAVLEQMRNRVKLFSALYKKPVKFFIVANYVEKSVKEEAEKEGATVIASYVIEEEE
jgi:chromosome segregation ATPase